ncbi:metallophosphoesterase family protein [Cohnella terricola]|uniref:Metallophosphoesterase family protein n=2 Tax=Cohnella terricola TaxID=1289167 RepID=A0A559J8X0_9BACL|nr:metallophosphoesterase family protein [Cohnella terricola]
MSQSFAVISDIHSNSMALEAVLQDISRRGIKVIVNLGDSLFGPIDPLGTAKLLMSNPNIVHVMGNCDQLLQQENIDSPSYRFVKNLIGPEIEHWIGTFKRTWTFEDLLFCHGTPYSNERYLLEEVDEAGVRYKTPDQLIAELQEIPQNYIFCGHSHVFQMIYLPDGKTIVNSGSVGLPAYYEETPYPHAMESRSPYASYVIAHKAADNHWRIEHIMLPYDWDKASTIARQNRREDYAYPIQTGRALLP